MNEEKKYPAHNIFEIDGVTFTSKFDNGNLLSVEKVGRKPHEYQIWSACDNSGTPYESKHCTWFYFTVSGLPQGCTIKINIMNPNRNSGLYRYDMRPVFKSSSTNQHWVRIRSAVKYQRSSDGPPLSFEHPVDNADGVVSFAFTYPYTYSMVQSNLDAMNSHVNEMGIKGSLYYSRELLANSVDGLRIDLVTISSVDGASDEQEPLLPNLFPDTLSPAESRRPVVFPEKEIVFVSARVHPGEVPAQHTWKGIFDFLLDPNDLRAITLRKKYVFKIVPILNPDGVYRGHFRCDQFGNNLNRHYREPDSTTHPSIFAVKHLLELYSANMALYLDLHAHASKRGCFIYGNVLDSLEHQVQNQLYCRMIAMNSAHFDYEGCLFSREHMQRIDPGDAASGLTAEGSGRVSTYIAHKLVHSYTLECNYNCSKYMNEIAPTDGDPGGKVVTQPSAYATTSEKYTPSVLQGVGRACMVALLDIRGENPCSRIPKSKVKTLERVRLAVINEVKQRSEYRGQVLPTKRRTSASRSAVGEVEPFAWYRRVDSDAKVVVTENVSEGGSGGGACAAPKKTAQRSKSVSNGSGSAVVALPKFAVPRRSKSSEESGVKGKGQGGSLFASSTPRGGRVAVAQQVVTAESVLSAKAKRGESNRKQQQQLAIPRIPKYDRAAKGHRTRDTERIVLSGKAVLAEDVLPVGGDVVQGESPSRPPSRYRLEVDRLLLAAERESESRPGSARREQAAVTPKLKRPGSANVRVSEYSPRALRDLGLPAPPSAESTSKTKSLAAPQRAITGV